MSHQPEHIFDGTQFTGTLGLAQGRVPMRGEAHREQWLVVERAGMPWAEAAACHEEPHPDIERAQAETKLPERLIGQTSNRFPFWPFMAHGTPGKAIGTCKHAIGCPKLSVLRKPSECPSRHLRDATYHGQRHHLSLSA